MTRIQAITTPPFVRRREPHGSSLGRAHSLVRKSTCGNPRVPLLGYSRPAHARRSLDFGSSGGPRGGILTLSFHDRLFERGQIVGEFLLSGGKPKQVAKVDQTDRGIGQKKVSHGLGLISRCKLSSSARIRSIRYRSRKYQAKSDRNAARHHKNPRHISGSRPEPAPPAITGCGCCVRHQRMDMYTMGTSKKPMMPTAAARLARRLGSLTALRNKR